ncbi:MAG: AgmX/PglI C-terminal domain-containing protein [Myxococcota bacterium]|nr:AgmX/PglI C-terminal domain-containing protein [Myxococcota bacterium]
MAKADAKILRIGIIQGGKIVEERLMRRRERISVGQSPKNTFYVPISKLPHHLQLFEVKNGNYQLILSEGLRGRISYDNKVHPLEALQLHSNVIEKGGVKLLPLTEQNRGKVVLGDIAILFQFVPAPPAVPKPQLPAAARGGLSQSIMAESSFLFSLLASLIFQVGFVALSLVFQTPPDKIKKLNRYVEQLKVDVEILGQEKEEEEEPEKKEQEEEEPEPDEEDDSDAEVEPPPVPEPPKPKRKPAPKRLEKPKAPEKKQKKVAKNDAKKREKVRKATLLKFVTAAGPGGNAGPDTLKNGHQERIATAFDPGGIKVADSADESVGFRGGPKLADGAGDARLKGLDAAERGKGNLTGDVKSSGRKVAKAKKERRVKARVGLRGPRATGGIGRLDGAQVSKVFRRRSSAFRSCYESRLKVNPNLSGKITLRFTIGTAGRITNISVAKNSTGDSAVGSCILRKVKRWKFASPEGGSKTFTYPIVLSKG